MSQLPTGTVTFLFTDIEGSTQMLNRLGPSYASLLAEHQDVVRAATAAHGGREVDTQGDSFFIAFPRAKDAVAAAVAIQRDLAAHSWPAGGEIKVRIGLHTGEPQVGEQRYVGMGVNKAARIGAAGHGGQVLLSRTTLELVEDELPPGVTIRDLGERRLKDIDRSERISQLVIEGLQSDFGQLKTLDVELARKRRRMYAGAALIGVLAAAIAIPVFALGQGSGGGTIVAPNSVAVIDPDANRVTDSVPVGIRPSAIAVGEGSVWVANSDDESLSKIDPSSRTVVSNPSLPYTPFGLAVGYGAVWIAYGILGSVARLESSVNNAVVETIDVTFRGSGGAVAVGEGSVWAAFSGGEVGKIDPRTNTRVPPNGVAGSSPSAVAVGEGSVWVANSGDNTVSQMNPRTTSEVRSYTVGGRPRAVTVGAGAIWVANENDDNVTRIDAASGSETNITVGDGPTGIAFGGSAVWVANAGDGTVTKIDAGTGDVAKTIRVGNRPTGVAFGEGAVWVSVQKIETA